MKLRSLAIIAMLFGASSAFAEPCSNQFADNATAKALAVFHEEGSTSLAKRAKLKATLKQVVDTDWIGRYVLGRAWNNATPAQQAKYLSVYGDYVINSYISKFDDDDALNVQSMKTVSYGPATSGGYLAKTIIVSKGNPEIHVDYIIDDSSGTCKVHDIRVENVSLIISQRSEFSNIANSQGIDAITAQMEQKLGR